MITALIIDDEPRARQALAYLVKTHCPAIGRTLEANGLEDAIPKIRTAYPAIVFLDISLKGATGFNLLNELGTYDFKLIFVTAHSEFAVQAFKYAAVDYLLKPVNIHELQQAVERSLSDRGRREHTNQLQAVVNNLSPAPGKKIVLRTTSEIFVVNTQDMIRLEAEGNYTIFHLKDKRKITMSVTLKEYEQLFAGLGFIRPHQSHLINTHFFEKWDKRNGGTIIMSDKSKVPVSVRKREELTGFLSAIDRS